jgi:hypothetical protein
MAPASDAAALLRAVEAKDASELVALCARHVRSPFLFLRRVSHARARALRA